MTNGERDGWLFILTERQMLEFTQRLMECGVNYLLDITLRQSDVPLDQNHVILGRLTGKDCYNTL